MQETNTIAGITIPSFRNASAQTDALGDVWNDVQSTQKTDYAAPHNRLRLIADEVDEGQYAFTVEAGDKFRVPFNDHFQKQLSSSLAPGLDRFGRHLLAEGQVGLFVKNHNDLLRDSDRKAQVRTVENGVPPHARAFLSDAYRTIDDDVVFGTALGIIGNHNDRWKAIGAKRTDLRTHVRIVSRDAVMEIPSGDRIRRFHVGFTMSNSEVGCGFAEFSAFFTDEFCWNGCIFSSMAVANVRFAHRGARISTDFGQIIGSQIERAKELEMRSLIEEATEVACGGKHQQQVIDLIERSSNRTVGESADITKVLEAAGNHAGLTKTEIEKLPVHYNADEPTLLGVQSAITRLAQDASSFDRRADIEKGGGKLLAASDSVWNSIANLS